ncbi:hypothetical protein PLESTB_000729700 [Pleodorina starrii]|uniref:Uncharacterized protein n=1 Tax=Pleodorina starrii TaxID=330485 RepID=A0A9W6BJJ1_9CHLO|nr:hypothetical protein PLESTM_000194300 [Pleodorina starrii]GLC53299.1 hypothetical protein PLESTB_000729700 [Pleodorina starrii]GLC67232.1 hypothetical protein PLESTF_000531600 [Pleodorina starrii]
MATPLAGGLNLPHICGHSCNVVHEFGNMYRCVSSGLMHICDKGCNQRLWHDRYTTICRISKKLHPPFEEDAMNEEPTARKRIGDDSGELNASWKRRAHPPVSC